MSRQDLDVNAVTDLSASTALHLCCLYGSLDAVRKLIERGANINAKNKRGTNPLHHVFGCSSDNIRVIDFARLLINYKVDYKAKTLNGNNALLVLCKYSAAVDLLEAARLLIVEQNIDVNQKNQSWENASHRLLQNKNASASKIIAVARLLIAKGIEVNGKSIKGRNALLQLLSSSPQRKDLLKQGMIELLIDSGIKLEAKDADGFTALHLVCKNSDGDILYDQVRILVEAGADINCSAIKGETAISLLFGRKKVMLEVPEDVVQFLLNSQ